MIGCSRDNNLGILNKLDINSGKYAGIGIVTAYGYGFNTKTGGVVENGLLFVDSKPGGATIYLNGQNQNETTSARMVLTGGAYDLSLKKDGYIDWQRRTTVSEHSVLRMVYPFSLS